MSLNVHAITVRRHLIVISPPSYCACTVGSINPAKPNKVHIIIIGAINDAKLKRKQLAT